MHFYFLMKIVKVEFAMVLMCLTNLNFSIRIRNTILDLSLKEGGIKVFLFERMVSLSALEREMFSESRLQKLQNFRIRLMKKPF